MKKVTHSQAKHIEEVQPAENTKKNQQKNSVESRQERLSYIPSHNQNNGIHLSKRVNQFSGPNYNHNAANNYNGSRVYYRNYADIQSTSRVRPIQNQSRQNAPFLKERLLNIQQHYEQLIQDEKDKNVERSEIILGLIDEMQLVHQEKISKIKKTIQEFQQRKRDVGEVDVKMKDIKGGVEDLIDESSALKRKNEQLQRKIELKSKVIRQKQSDLEELSRQLPQYRKQVKQLQSAKSKNDKINQEIRDIFNSAPHDN